MSHALVWTLTDAIPALIAFVLYGVFLLVIGYVAVFLAPIAACAASLFFTMVVVRFADHWMDNGSVGLSFDMAVQSSVEDLEEGWTWVFHRHRAPKSHEVCLYHILQRGRKLTTLSAALGHRRIFSNSTVYPRYAY